MSRPDVELVYVGGYGRSGSTVLDLVLSRELGAVSTGELWRLFDEAANHGPCSCGSDLVRCAFWGPVLESTKLSLSRDFAEIHRLSCCAEFSNRSSLDLWPEIWGSTFAAIRDLHGVTRVIDSSKTSGGMNRAKLLTSCESVEMVTFVHLIRDLPAVVHSLRRGSNRRIEGQVHAKPAPPALPVRGIAGWVRANAAATHFMRQSRVPAVRLRYEDLAAAPAIAAHSIGARAGWAESNNFTGDGHVVGGNRLARHSWDGTVKADDEWQSYLPASWKTIGRLVQGACSASGIV